MTGRTYRNYESLVTWVDGSRVHLQQDVYKRQGMRSATSAAMMNATVTSKGLSSGDFTRSYSSTESLNTACLLYTSRCV